MLYVLIGSKMAWLVQCDFYVLGEGVEAYGD